MESLKTIQMSELLKKFRTKADRVNFCRESGFYLPDLPGYDNKYFIQYLTGHKKLLPLGVSSGYSFRYFTKDKLFTKAHLYSFFENDQELKAYIPDDVSVDSLNREYMFAILAFAKKDVYLQLYNEYKKVLAESNYSQWQDYGLKLEEDMKKKIENFISTSGPSKERPFRLRKNGNQIQEIIPLGDDEVDMGE